MGFIGTFQSGGSCSLMSTSERRVTRLETSLIALELTLILQVAIFLPRKNWTHASPEDKAILTALEQTEILFLVQNLAYDDKMIIRYANEKKGIVLSNDRYRDVLLTNPELEDQIKNRFPIFYKDILSRSKLTNYS